MVDKIDTSKEVRNESNITLDGTLSGNEKEALNSLNVKKNTKYVTDSMEAYFIHYTDKDKNNGVQKYLESGNKLDEDHIAMIQLYFKAKGRKVGTIDGKIGSLFLAATRKEGIKFMARKNDMANDATHVASIRNEKKYLRQTMRPANNAYLKGAISNPAIQSMIGTQVTALMAGRQGIALQQYITHHYGSSSIEDVLKSSDPGLLVALIQAKINACVECKVGDKLTNGVTNHKHQNNPIDGDFGENTLLALQSLGGFENFSGLLNDTWLKGIFNLTGDVPAVPAKPAEEKVESIKTKGELEAKLQTISTTHGVTIKLFPTGDYDIGDIVKNLDNINKALALIDASTKESIKKLGGIYLNENKSFDFSTEGLDLSAEGKSIIRIDYDESPKYIAADIEGAIKSAKTKGIIT